MAVDSKKLARGPITVTVVLVTVMHTLDVSIANVVLPHIQGSIAASQDQISWVLTSYIVATAIMTAPTPFLAGLFGRRRFFFWSAVGFIAASVLCGMATSLSQLVLFRILQGAAGAGLLPLSLTILLDAYPPEEHPKASALYSFGAVIGPVLGPTLGGYITDALSWRWVFYVNLPVGILALLGIVFFIPDVPRKTRQTFDWFGFVALSLGVGALQLALDRGHSLDWFNSVEIITEVAIAALAAYIFIVHSATAKKPFIDLRLFADRNCVAGAISAAFITGILYSTLALLPTYLQVLMGMPVYTAGLLLAVRGGATMITMYLLSHYYALLGPRLIQVVGALCSAIGLYQVSQFNLSVGMVDICISNIFLGVGLAAISVPATALAFVTLPTELRAEASTLMSLTRNMGGSIGISYIVTRLARETQINHAQLTENITPFTNNLPELWDWTSTLGASTLNVELTRQAAAIAYYSNFYLMMWGALLLLPIGWMFRLPKPQT